MVEKRQLPARASARVELRTSKRRSAAYPRSESPPARPAKAAKREAKKEVKKEPTPPPPPPPPLPTALEAGEPLPSVETPQPADLSDEDFQTILESGVLTESLTRSRQKWLNEGLFEKYWSKPHKRKGVMIEDPKNPPKDTMQRAGAVTIIIEPHIIEATMYTVKGPKPPPLAQHPQQQMQPGMQYPQQNYQQGQLQQPIQPNAQRPIIQYGPANGSMPPAAATPAASSPVQAAPVAAPPPAPTATQPPAEPAKAPAATNPPQAAAASPAPAAPKAASTPAKSTPAAKKAATPSQTSSTPSKSAPAVPAAKPATNGPVIAMLAEKASREPPLRDLMKRVAVGQAKADELAQFQKIINQLTEEHEKKMLAQAPSADKLIVDGRTVQYFASEVRSILDIVLKSNPTQKAADLRAPEGSDPLLVLLVKLALDDQKVALSIRRLADRKHNSTDAQELKTILDRLSRESKAANPGHAQAGHMQMQNGARHMQPHVQYPNQQAIRAKAPLPNRPDIASVVFDLGTGDRYLFPKYSILEYLPTVTGQQLLASFLIVRKGSSSERGGDPSLDYYQPVTIRLQSTSGRHLEHLARVVAPQDEVRRYMDDVMDNMTRAEYVLLAMRLPRPGKEDDDEDESIADAGDDDQVNSKAPKQEPEGPSVLWTVKAGSSTPTSHVPRTLNTLDLEEEAQEKYQKLVRSTAERNTELV